MATSSIIKDLPSRQEILHSLDYNPETGIFTWIHPSKYVPWLKGHTAGCVGSGGYIAIKFSGGCFKAHRLAWVIIHGCNPLGVVDHKDGNIQNNRADNLRDLNPSQSAINKPIYANNNSGFKGVRAVRGKWRSVIRASGRRIHLGYYNTVEEGAAAYEAAALIHHGEFRRGA